MPNMTAKKIFLIIMLMLISACFELHNSAGIFTYELPDNGL